MKRIGIIGGLSAESTAIFYNTLTRLYVERYGNVHYPEIVIFSVSFGQFAEWAKLGDWVSYANGLAEGIRALEKAGADFGVISANTPHIVYDEVLAQISLPLVHIAETVAAAAKARGYRKLALLGTMATMNASFYPDILAKHEIECVVPNDTQKSVINTVLEEELYKGILTEESEKRYVELVSELRATGAEAVILGCTEIPMLLSDANSPLPVLDSSRILAQAALNEALKS